MPGRKGEKGLLLGGNEKVPHGFGLTGDCSSHTADGARSLNHGLLLLFLLPERAPRSFKGEERGPCSFGEGRGTHGFGGVGGENHTALAEWGPHGGDTADGAGSLNHRLLLLFLRYGTSDWAEREGRTVCICGYSKGL